MNMLTKLLSFLYFDESTEEEEIDFIRNAVYRFATVLVTHSKIRQFVLFNNFNQHCDVICLVYGDYYNNVNKTMRILFYFFQPFDSVHVCSKILYLQMKTKTRKFISQNIPLKFIILNSIKY